MNKFMIATAVGFLSIGLVACSEDSSEPEKVDSGNQEEANADSDDSGNKGDKENNKDKESKKDKEKEQKEFKLGDSIKKDGKVITIKKAERTMGGDMDSPDKGNEYLVATVEVKNKGDENISYNPFNYKIKNAQGQITDQAMTLFNQDTSLDSGELAPDGNVSGTISFQVPKDGSNSDLTIQIQNNMFSDSSIKVNLGK